MRRQADLLLNGLRLVSPEPEAYDTVIAVVEDRSTEEEVAAWIRARSDVRR